MRRCLIPANGYYEWRKSDRQPFYFVRSDGKALAFAGIFQDARGDDVAACIITTEANQRCRSIHHRMPVILQREDWGRWITSSELAEAERQKLFEPAAEGLVDFWPVGKSVGNVRNEGAALIQRVEMV